MRLFALRYDPFGGSAPGAGDPGDSQDPLGDGVPGTDDPGDSEDPLGDGVPGTDDPGDSEGPVGDSVPGTDDDLGDSVLPFAARLYEPPAPISAIVTIAASGNRFLLKFHSCVVMLDTSEPGRSPRGTRMGVGAVEDEEPLADENARHSTRRAVIAALSTKRPGTGVLRIRTGRGAVPAPSV